jgi:hypothetical protein
MSRYYEAPQEVYLIMDEVMEERFRELRVAKIRLVMDTKPKIDKLRNRVIFAYIKLANEVERFLTKDGHNLSGMDYFIFINDMVWELAGESDKKRIISHELRHCFVDEKGEYKIIKHDIEDFYEEVRLNEDDPMWGQALGTIAMAKIDQMKAEAKANR